MDFFGVRLGICLWPFPIEIKADIMKNIFYAPFFLSCISALHQFCFATEIPFVCFLLGYWFAVALIVIFVVRQRQEHLKLFLVSLYVIGFFVLWFDLWLFSTQCWRYGISRAKSRFWYSFLASIAVAAFTHYSHFALHMW